MVEEEQTVIFRYEDAAYERTGLCCQCGECCKSGDPFEGAMPGGTISGACPLLRLISAKDNLHICSDRKNAYYLNGCNVWPSHPGHIENYPSCTYTFTKVN